MLTVIRNVLSDVKVNGTIICCGSRQKRACDNNNQGAH